MRRREIFEAMQERVPALNLPFAGEAQFNCLDQKPRKMTASIMNEDKLCDQEDASAPKTKKLLENKEEQLNQLKEH